MYDAYRLTHSRKLRLAVLVAAGTATCGSRRPGALRMAARLAPERSLGRVSPAAQSRSLTLALMLTAFGQPGTACRRRRALRFSRSCRGAQSCDTDQKEYAEREFVYACTRVANRAPLTLCHHGSLTPRLKKCVCNTVCTRSPCAVLCPRQSPPRCGGGGASHRNSVPVLRIMTVCTAMDAACRSQSQLNLSYPTLDCRIALTAPSLYLRPHMPC